jgi:hypothetical protein
VFEHEKKTEGLLRAQALVSTGSLQIDRLEGFTQVHSSSS